MFWKTGRKQLVNRFSEQGNAGGIWKGPCGACMSRREPCVWEDGKVSCDVFQRKKVVCNLSRWKPHGEKAKRKGGSVINSNEDAQGKPEPKWWKVDPVLVVEIWQPARTMLSLFWDLMSMLHDHVTEQQKQTAILEEIAHVQELDREDWAFDRSKGLGMGMEGRKEVETEGKDRNGHVDKLDKGKGKERVEDGKVEVGKDGTEGGDGNGRVDGETLQ